jgi:hypothetical protein
MWGAWTDYAIQGSYLEVPFDEAEYNSGVSVMTLHHLLPARKRQLYGEFGKR